MLLSFGIYAIEMLTYPNAIQNKIKIPATFIFYPSLILFLVNYTKIDVRSKIWQVITTIQKGLLALLPVTVFVYLLLSYWERHKYTNFILSTFHIHLLGFEQIILAQAILGLFIFFKTLSFPKKRLNSRIFISIFSLIFFTIIHLIWQNLKIVVQTSLDSYVFIAKHPFATYDEKMTKAVSVYPYYKFVADQTPENAKIALPPFREPWTFTSNAGFTRYFLYPRVVENLNSVSELSSKTFTHALIAYDTPSEPYEEYGWPQEKIEGKNIFYFDFSSNTSTLSAKKTHEPHPTTQMERWGLIEL